MTGRRGPYPTESPRKARYFFRASTARMLLL